MRVSKRKLPLRTSIKVRPVNSTIQWAAGGQNSTEKMNKKQQKLMRGYLDYLERNRKQ